MRERSVVRERSEPIPDRSRIWTILAFIVILLISLARVLHLDFPLERDEGEFGYIAQQLIHGVPVYESGYTQKLPGACHVYALFLAAFGQTARAIHLGFLLVNAAIMGLVFLTLRRTHGGLAGVTGAFTFGFMALSPTVLGFAGHATFLVALFSTAGLYVFLLARDRGTALLYLGSGFFFGVAFLMKQHGIFFAPLLLGFMVVDAWSEPARRRAVPRHAAAFLAGALAPFLWITASFLAIGKFGLLWYWSFRFASESLGQIGLADGLKNFFVRNVQVASGFEILWLLAGAGSLLVLRDAVGRRKYLYLAFGLASFFSIVPGLYFSRHYYVSLLPFVALSMGVLMGTVSGRKQAGILGILVVVGMVVAFTRYEPYFTGRAPDQLVSRVMYPGNPFPESVEIGQYLNGHTAPGDSIAILGSEAQILFYAQRRSASRFLDAYFLTAEHARSRELHVEMIREIERVRPKYLIYVHIPWSWSMTAGSRRDILDWYEGYREQYRVEGIVQMHRRGSVISWGEDAGSVVPDKSYVEILRRIDDDAPAGDAAG